jgi:hypothetical protein
MKRGSIVIGALALAGVGALGILEVSAAPQSQRTARQRNQAPAANLNNLSPGGSEGGVAGGTTQPDVTVSRIGLNSSGSGDDIWYYGSAVVNGQTIRAFSMASTSCNIGNQVAEWITGGRNPVIAQNLYRFNSGRFEQIALSWLKHSFCAVSEPTCGSCSPTGCSTLGIGCADTYWATLNGDNNDMGPRWNKNPQGFGPNGVHNDIYSNPVGPNIIRGRLQVKDADMLPGSQYVAEIHYLTHDEPYANRYNNASHRLVNLSPTSMSGVGVGQGSVVFGKAAITAWKNFDSAVVLSTVNDQSPSGLFNLGVRVFDNGDGTWDYEYALHNMNSHRGAGSFSIPVTDGLTVSDIGFHDVDYHSGDGIGYVTQDGTDWPGAVESGAVATAGTDAADYMVWRTVSTYEENQNANALRWGTLYNFRFTANSPPISGQAGIGLFRPATGEQPIRVLITTLIPEPIDVTPCAGDSVSNVTFTPPGDGTIDAADLAYLLGQWGPNPGSPADVVSNTTFAPPPDDIVDGADLAYLLGNWGACN